MCVSVVCEAGDAAGNRQRSGQGAGTNAGAMPREPRSLYAVVWKLNADKSLEPVKVKTGITDFTNTALLDGNLKEGDQLVAGFQVAKSNASRLGGPGGGRPPGGR